MLFALVVVLQALITPASLYAYGNNFVATKLRADLFEIYDAKDYRMDIMATTLPPASAFDRSFTTAWLSVYTRENRTLEDPGFVQVGLLAQDDGLHWFAFGYAGIQCLRGAVYWEQPGTGTDWGCRGAVGDIVGLNQWHRVELVKYTQFNYWIARVYTTGGISYDVARILNPGNRPYYIEANFEEGWAEPIDPGLTGRFHLRNPQYLYGGVWKLFPKSGAPISQHNRMFLDRLEWGVPEYPYFCDETYGFDPDPNNEWQWVAGNTTSRCVWLFPPVRYDDTHPAVQYIPNYQSWSHGIGFPRAHRTTASWSNVGGYTVDFTTPAATPAQSSLSRVYTKASNRGSHNTYVNGMLVESGVSDYVAQTQWQTTKTWPVPAGQARLEVVANCCNYTDADAVIVDIPRADGALYDDRHHLFQYIGAWENGDGFSGPYQTSDSWTNSVEDAVTFTFAGSTITYYYTKAANRGWVVVSIDGGTPTFIYQYSPVTQWHVGTPFNNLGAGVHTIHISKPYNDGTYIDVDALCTHDYATCANLLDPTP
jgi:hypothetical protein